jgi:hypothetical protein
MCILASKHLFVFGGYQFSNKKKLNRIEYINLDRFKQNGFEWKLVTNINGEIPPCQMIKCIIVDELKVVLFGGLDKVNHLFNF